MKKIILLILSLSIGVSAFSGVDYYVFKNGEKIEYFLQGKTIELKVLKEYLEKVVKAAGKDMTIHIHFDRKVSISDVSKQLKLLQKLQFNDVHVLVMEKDESSTIIPIKLKKIKVEKIVELEDAPSLPDEKK